VRAAAVLGIATLISSVFPHQFAIRYPLHEQSTTLVSGCGDEVPTDLWLEVRPRARRAVDAYPPATASRAARVNGFEVIPTEASRGAR
jgi:hypothetical protein